jgi:hypothetical protein
MLRVDELEWYQAVLCVCVCVCLSVCLSVAGLHLLAGFY